MIIKQRFASLEAHDNIHWNEFCLGSVPKNFTKMNKMKFLEMVASMIFRLIIV